MIEVQAEIMPSSLSHTYALVDNYSNYQEKESDDNKVLHFASERGSLRIERGRIDLYTETVEDISLSLVKRIAPHAKVSELTWFSK